MKRTLRLLITAMTATAALIVLTSSATAQSLSFNPAGRISAPSQGLVRFFDPVTGVGVSCLLTLNGSLNRGLIAKARGAGLGYITEATMTHPCAEGRDAEIIRTLLPWFISYEQISGTLPNRITIIRILYNILILLVIPFPPFGTLRCGYQGNGLAFIAVTSLGGGSGSLYSTGLIRHDETQRIPLFDESLNEAAISCPAEIGIAGTHSLTRQTVLRL